MKTYITSDLHWGHRNILSFCPVSRARFRGDVDYMNQAMIKEWNDLITSEDTTYILGDVAFLPSLKAIEVMNRLNGTKILIAGNHDRKLLNDPVFRRCFSEIHDYLEITYEGTKVCMFHYPIAEFNGQHKGAVHLHGHLHGGVSGLEQFRVRDMGMDATGMIAISMEDAIKSALKGQIKGHHTG